MREHECDICGSKTDVEAGRWIFYCPEHKANDWEKTQENELSGDWVDYALNDGELSEMILDNM